MTRRLEYNDASLIRSQFTDPLPAEFGNFFGYDGRGRMIADTFAIVETDECNYDSDDGWVCPDPTADSVHVYKYDDAGNREDHSGSYGTGHRITAFDGCSYSTDDDGNVTARDCGGTVTNFYWDSQDRLIKLKAGGDSVEFRYDTQSRLVRRDVNGSVDRYFLWSGANLFAELNSSGAVLVEYSYYPGLDRLHAIAVGDSVYFGHTDGFGNVIGLVSHTKRYAASYAYDRWGHSESNQVTEHLGSDSVTNRARFKGALWMGDEGIELYYMRNRWYEPKTGRFLSEDPARA